MDTHKHTVPLMLTLMLMIILMLNTLSKLCTSSDSSKLRNFSMLGKLSKLSKIPKLSKLSKPSKLSYASHERVFFPKTSGYMTEINFVRLVHNSIYATHVVVIAGFTTLRTQEAVQH